MARDLRSHRDPSSPSKGCTLGLIYVLLVIVAVAAFVAYVWFTYWVRPHVG